MKILYFLFLPVILLIGYNIGLRKGKNTYKVTTQWTEPYIIYTEKVTEAQKTLCKLDENCMDILEIENAQNNKNGK